MRRMLNRNALVRQLVAAETLGSVNVLCVDKTGTLTTGEMTVAEIRRGTSLLDSEHIQAQDSDVLRILSRVITTRVDGQMTGEPKLIGAPTEVSIMRYLISQSDKFTEEPFQVIDELPFDSARKYSARLLRDQHGEKAIIMGAPDVLLGLADIDDGTMQSYQATLQDMTSRGLRVLLFAEKVLNSSQDLKPDNLKDLQPLGLVGLVDPLRPRATQTIQAAQAAGVRVIMITGDHLGTAAAVATQLGLPTNEDNLLLGRQLAELDNATLQRRLRSVSVFARVLPEHKLRIVQALQSSGYTVAMTGDGVNDAPALRAADIGVAVGSGTEVAKETADVVILDNDVSSIVAAIREGRIIFDNIRKVLVYLLTFSLSEVILLAILLALGLPILLAPIHILWINLVTDGLPSIALAFEKEEPGIMQEPPRDKQAPLIDAGMQKLMTTSAILAIAGMVMTYIFFKAAQLDENTLRSVLFLLLGLDSLMAIFALRNLRRPFWQQPPFTNPSLSFAFIFGGVLLILPLIQPNLIRIFEFANLNVQIWLPLVLLAIFKLMLIELAKFLFLSPVRQATPRLVS
jgi:Ca2+-transporting ATPase